MARKSSCLVATNNNLTACVKIKAPFSKIRKARNKNTKKDKMPKDSLALINLDKMSVCKYEQIKSYKSGVENNNIIAYIQQKAPNKNKKKKAEKEKPLRERKRYLKT